MEHQEIVDKILSSVKEEVEKFVAEESSITDSIEYEERVLELSRKFARGLISGTCGKLPKSRNSKKSPD